MEAIDLLLRLNWEEPTEELLQLLRKAQDEVKNMTRIQEAARNTELSNGSEFKKKSSELSRRWEDWRFRATKLIRATDSRISELKSQNERAERLTEGTHSRYAVKESSPQFSNKSSVNPNLQPAKKSYVTGYKSLEQVSGATIATMSGFNVNPFVGQQTNSSVFHPVPTRKKRVYVYQKDFPLILEELRRLSNDHDFSLWQIGDAIPSDGPLLHFEDVVTRLDDQYLPEAIKSLNTKWGGRYALVSLFKQGSSSMANYSNTDYETTIVPGIVVKKGIYAGKMSNDGITSGYKKVITTLALKEMLLQLC